MTGKGMNLERLVLDHSGKAQIDNNITGRSSMKLVVEKLVLWVQVLGLKMVTACMM